MVEVSAKIIVLLVAGVALYLILVDIARRQKENGLKDSMQSNANQKRDGEEGSTPTGHVFIDALHHSTQVASAFLSGTTVYFLSFVSWHTAHRANLVSLARTI